jgi:hypothetical protein
MSASLSQTAARVPDDATTPCSDSGKERSERDTLGREAAAVRVCSGLCTDGINLIKQEYQGTVPYSVREAFDDRGRDMEGVDDQ